MSFHYIAEVLVLPARVSSTRTGTRCLMEALDGVMLRHQSEIGRRLYWLTVLLHHHQLAVTTQARPIGGSSLAYVAFSHCAKYAFSVFLYVEDLGLTLP